MNINKQIDFRFTILLKNYQDQLTKQRQLGEFYKKKLSDLVVRQEKLENMKRGTFLVQPEQKNIDENDKIKRKIVANLSNKSIEFKNQSRIQSKSVKKEQQSNDFQFQYNSLVKSIARNLQIIVNKTQRSEEKKPFQTKSALGRYQIQKSLKTLSDKLEENKSTLSPNKRSKEESEEQLPTKQQLALDFGNNSLLESQDQIVNNLVRKLKQEQEKYVEGLLTQTELIIKQKMSNYLQKQIQKKEQLLYNMKQRLISKSLNRVSSNKLTVKTGYTQKMKQLVQIGLKNMVETF